MTITCIIGTDTSIGKTYSCCQIMKYITVKNQTVATLKPIATGIEYYDRQLLNEDVYQLAKYSNYRLSYKQINPFCFNQPIAPHIAASLDRQSLSVADIAHEVYKGLNHAKLANHVLIEGVGGLMVPLNNKQLYIDIR